jgi:hypothetical protein
MVMGETIDSYFELQTKGIHVLYVGCAQIPSVKRNLTTSYMHLTYLAEFEWLGIVSHGS